MSTVSDAKDNPQLQFWDKMEKCRTVMLGSPNHRSHMQPMTPFAAREEDAIWFFVRKDADLTKETSEGGDVHMCLMAPDGEYQACVFGKLEIAKSRGHVERFWNPVVAAWYPDGKSDPALTMLRFSPRDAQIWASNGSAMRFGWEIAKANITGKKPDVGHSEAIKL